MTVLGEDDSGLLVTLARDIERTVLTLNTVGDIERSAIVATQLRTVHTVHTLQGFLIPFAVIANAFFGQITTCFTS